MKVQDCFAIVRMLNGRPKTTAKELANTFGVSTRTIYRYLEELTIAGIPINTEHGRYGGISLDEKYRKDKYKFTV